MQNSQDNGATGLVLILGDISVSALITMSSGVFWRKKRMLVLPQHMTPVLERQLLTFLAGVVSGDKAEPCLCLPAAMSESPNQACECLLTEKPCCPLIQSLSWQNGSHFVLCCMSQSRSNCSHLSLGRAEGVTQRHIASE